ncbi:hypothetical protein [Methanosarcina sp. 2.H.T.1A.15]|uniref:hypothetical protein n=1 Tax=Methanosarcina sp. 2.H.T.1A.15 TaxID=1483596 RepID=UPI0012E08DC6|nr:hypothetical protein [Methanosarcina sp. 2.H.T.1A.15]
MSNETWCGSDQLIDIVPHTQRSYISAFYIRAAQGLRPTGMRNDSLTPQTVFQFTGKYKRSRQLVWQPFPKRRKKN